MKLFRILLIGLSACMMMGCSSLFYHYDMIERAETSSLTETIAEETTVYEDTEKDSEILESIVDDRDADGNALISIYDFGATGDGKADDTTAIQKAIDSDQPVYFPKGIYVVSSPIVINNKIYWSMYARDATFKYTGTEYAFRILSAENCHIEIGQINSMSGGGIEFCGDSIRSWNQYVSLSFNCIECKTDCIHVEVSGDGWSSENQIYGGRFKAGENGVNVLHTGRNYTNGWKFYNCGIEGVKNGFLFNSGKGYINDMVIVNSRYEESYDTILKTEGSVYNCIWIGASTVKKKEIKCSEHTTQFEIIAPIGKNGHRGCIINGKLMIEKTQYKEAK